MKPPNHPLGGHMDGKRQKETEATQYLKISKRMAFNEVILGKWTKCMTLFGNFSRGGGVGEVPNSTGGTPTSRGEYLIYTLKSDHYLGWF